MNEENKPILKRPIENPWYLLATLYGELSKDSEQNFEIAQKNRIAWNRWFAKALSAERRDELLKKGFPPAELEPFSPVEEEELAKVFATRSGRNNQALPDPTAEIDFSYTIFDRQSTFDGFIFPNKADFNWATFSDFAKFGSATFSDSADFRSATFSDGVDFGSATFSEEASFHSAKFSGLTFFTSTKFSGKAIFESAKFSGFAFFISAKFSGYGYFKSATFSDGADFRSATFSDGAYFGSATFSEDASFHSAKFSKGAYFDSARFSLLINFWNSEFTAEAIFANAHFYSNAPDFRGAKMHEATEWHGVIWPSIPTDKENAQQQVYTYERLKQEMERLKKHEDEQFFFRKELRVRREMMPLWSVARFFNFLYEAFSDYGQSTNKPLLWLCGSFLLGGAGFAWSFNNAGTSWTILHAASLSFASNFPLLPLYKEIISPDVFASLSNLAKIIIVVQSIFGTLMLFLLGLALRNRFRMR